eukprot:13670450-Alexandrium_andersonii.AAC.1
MCMLALKLTAWLRTLEATSPFVRGRVLADDLLLCTEEGDEAHDLQVVHTHFEAVQSSCDMLHAMGATVSTDKSVTSASTARLRGLCKRQKLRGAADSMPVVGHFRDLGAHLRMHARLIAPT